MTGLVVHHTLSRSRANGPGERFVVWVQGCSLGCPGCFNPATHELGDNAVTVETLLSKISASGCTGLTVSGGEPFEQPEGLAALVSAAKNELNLSVLVFTGYTIEHVTNMALGPDILNHVDVLIDGRYEAKDRLGEDLRGSRNQRIHLLSKLHTMSEVVGTPELEVQIDHNGTVRMTGVAPIALKKKN